MAVEPIVRRPWEDTDPERIAKFSKGIHNQTSDRWTAQPDIDACWRGDYRDWHIEDGKHYQEQLYCRFWEDFINPSGFACEGCKQHAIINWQSSHLSEAMIGLIAALGQETAGELIVQAVENRKLTREQALILVERYNLS